MKKRVVHHSILAHPTSAMGQTRRPPIGWVEVKIKLILARRGPGEALRRLKNGHGERLGGHRGALQITQLLDFMYSCQPSAKHFSNALKNSISGRQRRRIHVADRLWERRDAPPATQFDHVGRAETDRRPRKARRAACERKLREQHRSQGCCWLTGDRSPARLYGRRLARRVLRPRSPGTSD